MKSKDDGPSAAGIQFGQVIGGRIGTRVKRSFGDIPSPAEMGTERSRRSPVAEVVRLSPSLIRHLARRNSDEFRYAGVVVVSVKNSAITSSSGRSCTLMSSIWQRSSRALSVAGTRVRSTFSLIRGALFSSTMP